MRPPVRLVRNEVRPFDHPHFDAIAKHCHCVSLTSCAPGNTRSTTAVASASSWSYSPPDRRSAAAQGLRDDLERATKGFEITRHCCPTLPR
jgi:hypothetical protein